MRISCICMRISALYCPDVQKLRYKEMAKVLGISERLLKNWVRDRIVPFIKIHRAVLFDPLEVDAALDHFKRKVKQR